MTMPAGAFRAQPCRLAGLSTGLSAGLSTVLDTGRLCFAVLTVLFALGCSEPPMSDGQPGGAAFSSRPVPAEPAGAAPDSDGVDFSGKDTVETEAPTEPGTGAAIAGDLAADPPMKPTNMVRCAEPRPEVCTREYRPVCALRDTGKRCLAPPCEGATEWVTRPNACDACTDPKVIGHRPGACDAEGARPRTMLDY